MALASEEMLRKLFGTLGRTRVPVSTATATNIVLATAAGTLYRCVFTIDPALAGPTTYYVQVLDATTLQADGAFLKTPLINTPIDHVNGTRDQIDLGAAIGNGIPFTAGAVLVLSSSPTQVTHVAAASLWLTGAEIGA